LNFEPGTCPNLAKEIINSTALLGDGDNGDNKISIGVNILCEF
jgi:hypothetical protein